MGREKDRLIEGEERGWYSLTRRLVCDSCVRDDFLSAYIAHHGEPAVCDYCGLDPEQADIRCLPFDDLMDVIGDGINWAYNSADREYIPYESAEGGYAFPEHVFDTYDLVVDQIGLDVADDVLQDILRALPDQCWCQKHFYALSLADALRLGWQEFVEQVKYERRYLFTLPEASLAAATATRPEEASSEDALPPQPESGLLFDPHVAPDAAEFPGGDPDFGIDYDRQDGIPVYSMLEAIGKIVHRLDLV